MELPPGALELGETGRASGYMLHCVLILRVQVPKYRVHSNYDLWPDPEASVEMP